MLIDNTYLMGADGIVFNCKNGTDVPPWIFQFRDFVLKYSEIMNESEIRDEARAQFCSLYSRGFIINDIDRLAQRLQALGEREAKDNTIAALSHGQLIAQIKDLEE